MSCTDRHHRLGARGALLLAAALVAAPLQASAKSKPGTIENGQLKPGEPPAASYGPDKSKSCPTGGVFRIVSDSLPDTAKRNKIAQPEQDGRLCAVAEAFLGWDPAEQGKPRREVLEFVAHHYGLAAPIADVTIAIVETEELNIVAERILEPLANFAANTAHPRYGLLTQRISGGGAARGSRAGSGAKTKVVLVLQEASVEVEGLPRKLAANAAASLQGTLLPPYRNPKVLVGDPKGELARPEQAPGQAFKAEIKCGAVPGTIYVEIRGERPDGTMMPVIVPVACATEVPDKVAVAAPAWPTEIAEQEKKLLELVNAERTQVGLKPLVLDDALAGISREIAGSLRDEATKGTGGEPDIAGMLKKAGIKSQLVVQSAAADRTVDGAHQRLLRSPTNRANLLTPEVTNAGIGVAAGTDAGGLPVVFVNELFIKELPPLDVAKTKGQLQSAVAQKRKDARTNPVAVDPTLDKVAQEWADALAAAGGNLPKEKVSVFTAELNKGFKTVRVVSGARAEATDFAEEPEITMAAKAVGVGVAQGKHPTLGRNAVYVSILLATPRGAGEAAEEKPAKPKAGKPAAQPAAKKAAN